MKTFKELGLDDEFVSILQKNGIINPSEIQEKTIPLVLAGKDVISGSATGSGKTLVFASAIIENLKKKGNIQALILTPTRELAEQIAGSIKNFSKHKKLKILSIYGGVNIVNQIRSIKDADIIVGTPGRILDHLERKTLDLNWIKFLVLDEVDRMFDMGFKFDVERILREVSENRQTMLFSATISSDIDYLAKKYTKNPVTISVESHLNSSKLKQIYYDVPDGLKFSLFVQLLKKEKAPLVMVFCSTRRNVDFVTNNLIKLGIQAKAIHGGMNQSQRNRALEDFHSKHGVNVLVCTDVAARGIDIKGVSHVYNYDLPKDGVDYIHRIGRTARAEKNGIAINILCGRDYENFRNILRDEKLKIDLVELPKIKRVEVRKDFQRGNFRNSNNRSEKGKSKRRGDSKGNYQKRKSNIGEKSSRDNSKRISEKDSRNKNYERKDFKKKRRSKVKSQKSYGRKR